MCSKNLKGIMSEWLPFYEQEHGVLSKRIREDLLKISAATIDRILTTTRAKHGKGKSLTRPGRMLRNHYFLDTLFSIPVVTHYVDVNHSGHAYKRQCRNQNL